MESERLLPKPMRGARAYCREGQFRISILNEWSQNISRFHLLLPSRLLCVKAIRPLTTSAPSPKIILRRIFENVSSTALDIFQGESPYCNTSFVQRRVSSGRGGLQVQTGVYSTLSGSLCSWSAQLPLARTRPVPGVTRSEKNEPTILTLTLTTHSPGAGPSCCTSVLRLWDGVSWDSRRPHCDCGESFL